MPLLAHRCRAAGALLGCARRQGEPALSGRGCICLLISIKFALQHSQQNAALHMPAQGRQTNVPALPHLPQVDSLHAQVVGKLPPWLHGSFYRNGPGAPPQQNSRCCNKLAGSRGALPQSKAHPPLTLPSLPACLQASLEAHTQCLMAAPCWSASGAQTGIFALPAAPAGVY